MTPFLSSQKDSVKELNRIFAGEAVCFRFPGLTDARFSFISGFVYRLLGHYDLAYLSEMVLVLLKEIISNASKANAKRIFFNSRNVDAADAATYDKAIRSFSQEVLRDWDEFLKDNQTSDYYIEVEIAEEGPELVFRIRNNVEILPREWERIRSKFESFKKFKDINTAFTEIRDESEGAGLGIFLILSLLENVRVSADNYRIESKDGVTMNEVRIPRALSSTAFQGDFYKKVVKEIEDLPSFPENITQLLDLCDSDNASVSVIAAQISKDPSLTAQILKLVNSAGYMNRFRNPGLEDAVKIIGLKVIRNLLMVSGARNVIHRRYRIRDLEQIWEDANRVSFYARRLAKDRGGAQLAEQVTVAGLLFELGKIVMLSLRPEIVRSIQKLVGAKRVRNSAALEETMLGISHPAIGAFMAGHWNFPEPLVAAIRYQQMPLLAPEEHADPVRVIYVAAGLHQAAADQLDYWSMEPEVIAEFGIHTEEQFLTRMKQFAADYESSSGEVI